MAVTLPVTAIFHCEKIKKNKRQEAGNYFVASKQLLYLEHS